MCITGVIGRTDATAGMVRGLALGVETALRDVAGFDARALEALLVVFALSVRCALRADS